MGRWNECQKIRSDVVRCQKRGWTHLHANLKCPQQLRRYSRECPLDWRELVEHRVLPEISKFKLTHYCQSNLIWCISAWTQRHYWEQLNEESSPYHGTQWWLLMSKITLFLESCCIITQICADFKREIQQTQMNFTLNHHLFCTRNCKWANLHVFPLRIDFCRRCVLR